MLENDIVNSLSFEDYLTILDLIPALAVHLAVGGRSIMIDRMFKHDILKGVSFKNYLTIQAKAKQILDDAGVNMGESSTPALSSSSSGSRGAASPGSARMRNKPTVPRAPPQASIGGVSQAEPTSPFGSVIYLPETATANASRRFRYSNIGNKKIRTQFVRKTPLTDREIREREKKKRERAIKKKQQETCNDLCW